MLRGLYSAANAMRYRVHEVETIANNLANVSTDGYKRDRIAMRSFGDMLMSRIERHPENISDDTQVPPCIGVMNLGGPIAESEFVDFSPGTPRTTGNPLDIYIQGPGFFVVETDQGERFTRNGNFMLDNEGKIVTNVGNTVQGTTGGELRIIDTAPFSVNSNGEIVQNGLPIGQLRIVEFPDIRVIEKDGGNNFRMIDNTLPQPYRAQESTVEQGVIEGSNVDTIRALVRLISAQRSYEAAARAVDMFNQSLQRVCTELGSLPG